MMLDQNEITFPDSPVEMASWVRDRSMKIVEELTKVIGVIRNDPAIAENLQGARHFPISAALANAIKLAAFSSGHHLSEEELSSLVGSIYHKGLAGYDELRARLSSDEDPILRTTYEKH